MWKDPTNIHINCKKKKSRHRRFSEQVDFGKYMKLWRFKQIKLFIPFIMVDENMKSEGDDWYKCKQRVNDYIKKRATTLFVSHVITFDESMSAFIPR